MADAAPKKTPAEGGKKTAAEGGKGNDAKSSPPAAVQPPANDGKPAVPALVNVPAPPAQVAEAPATPLEARPPEKAEAKPAETAPPAEGTPEEKAPEAPEKVAAKTEEKTEEKKSAGLDKWLRRVGMTDLADAMQATEKRGEKIAHAIFSKIGFGDIYKATRQEKGKTRGVLTAVFNKAADMAAGRVVSVSFRLIVITFVAGMIGGVSTWGSIALLALATGASSAIYTYGKKYLGDKFTGPKEKRAQAKFIDRDRAKEAGVAFLTGTFNGGFGAWLAKLPLFQHFMDMVRGSLHDAMNRLPTPSLSEGPSQASSSFSQSLMKPFKAAASAVARNMPGGAVPKPSAPVPGI